MTRALMTISLGMLLLATPAAFSCGSDDTGTETDSAGSIDGTGIEVVGIAAVFDPSAVKPIAAFPALDFDDPVFLTSVPGEADRLAVVEQAGGILVFANSEVVDEASVFLDISDRVHSGGEEGLLGLAFDPGFEENGLFYVYYSAADPRRTVLSRFERKDTNGDGVVIADTDSEQVLLQVEQPYSNHNGGTIAFGPDGYLYLGLGDGGSGGDPFGNAQDPSTLLGSILRIDVGDAAAAAETGASYIMGGTRDSRLSAVTCTGALNTRLSTASISMATTALGTYGRSFTKKVVWFSMNRLLPCLRSVPSVRTAAVRCTLSRLRVESIG